MVLEYEFMTQTAQKLLFVLVALLTYNIINVLHQNNDAKLSTQYYQGNGIWSP